MDDRKRNPQLFFNRISGTFLVLYEYPASKESLISWLSSIKELQESEPRITKDIDKIIRMIHNGKTLENCVYHSGDSSECEYSNRQLIDWYGSSDRETCTFLGEYTNKAAKELQEFFEEE